MAVDIIAGAALGLLIQLIHQSIQKARDASITTRAIFDRLHNTIVTITPLIFQIEEIQKDLDESSKKVIQNLNNLLQKIDHVLDEYAKLNRINVLERRRYRKEIAELEDSLKEMIANDVQVDIWSDIKQIMSKISRNHNIDESKIYFHIRWSYNKKKHMMRFAME